MQYPYSIPQSNCGGPPPYFTYQYPCSYYPNVSYFPRKTKRKTKQKYYIDDSSDEDDYCPRPNYYPNACTPNNPYPIIPMSPMNPFYPFPQQSYYPNYGTYPFSEDKKSKSKKSDQSSESDKSDCETEDRVDQDEQDNVSEINFEENCDMEDHHSETKQCENTICIRPPRNDDDCDSIPVNMIHLFTEEESYNNLNIDNQSICSEPIQEKPEEDTIVCNNECKKENKKEDKKNDGKITLIVQKKKPCIHHGTKPQKHPCLHQHTCNHKQPNNQVVVPNKQHSHNHNHNHNHKPCNHIVRK